VIPLPNFIYALLKDLATWVWGRRRLVKNELIVDKHTYSSSDHLVTYAADLAKNISRLRVYIDYSTFVEGMGTAGWTDRRRVLVGEFRDYVRDQRLIIPILMPHEENEHIYLKWGGNRVRYFS
jgi:hypothetical protein